MRLTIITLLVIALAWVMYFRRYEVRNSDVVYYPYANKAVVDPVCYKYKFIVIHKKDVDAVLESKNEYVIALKDERICKAK